MKTIYFDESGFTGYNFLDPHQPMFAIASTDIEPKISEEILKASFPKYRGKEFKFSNIVNSSNELGLVKFGELMKPFKTNCFFFIIDKKFVTLLKIVDFLIEPSITKAGFDFYADGFCRKFANYLFIAFTVISDKKIYAELIKFYQDFSRKPSNIALKVLTANLINLQKQVGPEVSVLFDQLISGSLILDDHINMDTFKSSNDLKLTSMLATVSWWRTYHTEDFAVIHDNSSNFMRQKAMWDAITNPSVPEFQFPLPDGYVPYPLRVKNTTGVESENNYSVKLCDVLAGFVTQNAKNNDLSAGAKPIYQEAITAGLGELMSDGLMPGTEFPVFPPKRLTAPDQVDLMAALINRANTD
ncbi:DUF3800 domain-containing protein [Pedobacter agri]|uniref:DUF3800 domain-containing protein n=1 Tax=Pedobacter agri TaxID=454586 RepID=UPI002930324F|nr:DUF3800 domain-containing protein [Pedobacter agri]